MNENTIRLLFAGVPSLVFIIGGIAAFYNMKGTYKDELRKTEKEFADKIEKQNERIGSLKDKLSGQDVELEKLKAKDENQQQIINQLDKLIYDLIPSLSKNINSQSKREND
ncbi:hypothetical protein [Flavobacterium sp. WV_118_3]|uniref:hypothetical protein n=1 Tax=Flavobacterium sp. WV_118_3 TaxID=3151764 RepID=UPI00321BFBE9